MVEEGRKRAQERERERREEDEKRKKKGAGIEESIKRIHLAYIPC